MTQSHRIIHRFLGSISDARIIDHNPATMRFTFTRNKTGEKIDALIEGRALNLYQNRRQNGLLGETVLVGGCYPQDQNGIFLARSIRSHRTPNAQEKQNDVEAIEEPAPQSPPKTPRVITHNFLGWYENPITRQSKFGTFVTFTITRESRSSIAAKISGRALENFREAWKKGAFRGMSMDFAGYFKTESYTNKTGTPVTRNVFVVRSILPGKPQTVQTFSGSVKGQRSYTSTFGEFVRFIIHRNTENPVFAKISGRPLDNFRSEWQQGKFKGAIPAFQGRFVEEKYTDRNTGQRKSGTVFMVDRVLPKKKPVLV